jgi:hypothetical protein
MKVFGFNGRILTQSRQDAEKILTPVRWLVIAWRLRPGVVHENASQNQHGAASSCSRPAINLGLAAADPGLGLNSLLHGHVACIKTGPATINGAVSRHFKGFPSINADIARHDKAASLGMEGLSLPVEMISTGKETLASGMADLPHLMLALPYLWKRFPQVRKSFLQARKRLPWVMPSFPLVMPSFPCLWERCVMSGNACSTCGNRFVKSGNASKTPVLSSNR